MSAPARSTSRTWAVERLKPPTTAELRLAYRVGVDPNTLLGRFADEYSRAATADAATIDELVGDSESCGPEYRRLWDEVNQVAEDRRHEWWVAPLEAVAQILNPSSTTSDLDNLARAVRSTGRVGFGLKFTPARRASLGCTVAPRRAPRARRPAGRRTTSASATASAGDGSDSSDGDPPGLVLAPKPAAILTYGLVGSTPEERGEVVR